MNIKKVLTFKVYFEDCDYRYINNSKFDQN